MESEFIYKTLQSASEIEPNFKEILLLQAEREYNNGNKDISVYYQVHALVKAFEDRYSKKLNIEDRYSYSNNYLTQMNERESQDIQTNRLMQYVFKELVRYSQVYKSNSETRNKPIKDISILKYNCKPASGLKEVMDICHEMPNEWTIIQLCKGPRIDTSYNIYTKIHESSANVYVTLLKHALSDKYSIPVCIRLDIEHSVSVNLFQKFASTVDRFKEIIAVDPKDFESNEARAQYWEKINNFDYYLQQILDDLKSFVYPWNFLFYGICVNDRQTYENILKRVKSLFNEKYIAEDTYVLLSLAAFHVSKIDERQIHAICNSILKNNAPLQESIKKFLLDLHEQEKKSELERQYYPCVLIVDERLDHFFWEELNVQQEFTRVNSLQCLWRLYQQHKSNMCKGYYLNNVSDGCCLIDPERNLPKTEMRMRSFFEYWAPNWNINSGRKPTQEEFFKKFFQSPCYVYAGHGSGLQYINGKHIAKQLIKCVVLLFGCDSSRLHSNGLYSELVGAHAYYHAAMCPSFVGTLMPGLDANMDGVATEILSRWIKPASNNIPLWNEIEKVKWLKEGKVCLKEPNCDKQKSNKRIEQKCYQLPSLCAIVALVHQRINETKYYNTVPYICRGLPAWNSNIVHMPI